MANNFNNSTIGSGDAVAAQARSELKNYVDWLSTNGVKGLVGEFGWPGSSGAGQDPLSSGGAIFDPRWDAVAQQWFIDVNAAGLYTTNWAGGSEWGIDLRAYRTADGNNHVYDYRTTVSSILEANYTTGGSAIRGINMPGADYSTAGGGGAVNLSTATQPGAGYYYPTSGDWAMMYSRGVRLVRLPFMWERVQTTLKGPLNHDISLYIAAVTAAGAAGIKVLVDQHNYGRYDTNAATNTTYSTSGVLNLGDNAPSSVGGTMTSCFVDFWSRMATALVGNAGLWGYGLTNEVHDLTGGLSAWQNASRLATEAIRLIDQNAFISVGGYLYSGIQGWVANNGSTPWLTETIPAGQTGAGSARNTDPKIIFEGHHYWDANNDHSGTYHSTYDAEISKAQSNGYTSYTNSGYVAPSTGNTQQTGPRPIFKSSLDSTGDFSGLYDSIPTGTNTVTIPYTTLGNPGNSMQVISTSTADTGGVRKSTGAVYRTLAFDIYIPTGSNFSSTSSYTVAHLWQDNNSTDLIEMRVVGTSGSFQAGLTVPSGTYAFVNTLGTNLAYGVWHTLTLTMTDTAITLNVDGNATAEATQSGSYTGISSGGFHVGKFYSGSYVGAMYFDNIIASLNATYWAPPNGGYLAPLTGGGGGGGGGGGAAIGLMEDF